MDIYQNGLDHLDPIIEPRLFTQAALPCPISPLKQCPDRDSISSTTSQQVGPQAQTLSFRPAAFLTPDHLRWQPHACKKTSSIETENMTRNRH
jgi:hypothetical protein